MEWPLMVVAVVFLVAYSAQIVTDASGVDYERYELVLNICWAVFGIDYLVRLVTAPEKWRWFKANLVDFFSVALPFLRPLRLVRLVALLRIFQRSADAELRNKISLYTGAISALLIWVGALTVLEAERHAEGATLTDLGRALWWSLVTVTTVGYGDIAPVTVTGRVVAAIYMLFGIALIGIVTGIFSSWFLERIKQEEGMKAEEPAVATAAAAQQPEAHAQLEKQIAELTQEVRLLRAEVAAAQAKSHVRPTPR